MKNVNTKIIFVLLLLIAAAPLFAQELVPAGMTTLAEDIMKIFKHPIVTIIFGIIFCSAAAAFAYNKDNEKLRAKIIPIIVAAGLIGGASFIMDKVMSAAS